METATLQLNAGFAILAMARYIRRILVAALLAGPAATTTRTPLALEALDDRMLRDIGLHRDQLPFLHNAIRQSSAPNCTIFRYP